MSFLAGLRQSGHYLVQSVTRALFVCLEELSSKTDLIVVRIASLSVDARITAPSVCSVISISAREDG